MEKHYEKFKQTYDDFVTALMRKGVLPAKDTGIGFWGITPLNETKELFSKIKLNKDKSFIDLGSGDGRITLLASLFEVQSTGIEGDKWLHENANFIKNKLNFRHFENVNLIKDDFMQHDLSNYDTIFVSPDRPFHRGLERKLSMELKGRVIVHGWEFHPTTLKQVEEHIINGEKFKIYTRN